MVERAQIMNGINEDIALRERTFGAIAKDSENQRRGGGPLVHLHTTQSRKEARQLERAAVSN